MSKKTATPAVVTTPTPIAPTTAAPAPAAPAPWPPVGHFDDQADEVPATGWAYHKLWKAVRDCLFILPEAFDLGINLPALPAKDLHSANTLLGSAIEDHIPSALNKLRNIWDE